MGFFKRRNFIFSLLAGIVDLSTNLLFLGTHLVGVDLTFGFLRGYIFPFPFGFCEIAWIAKLSKEKLGFNAGKTWY